ncbi:hypothetical protein [Pectobacterium punjabense]|uniref:hypothetical protein n=1 Tax=Pectobacterium punjabense TaxID=2108399 RepID=UPI002404B390|nr:hypothetical protein [Pectobacterium punjabense]MDG0795532.1 hypothetical protein [Pectobacterium punjabense]
MKKLTNNISEWLNNENDDVEYIYALYNLLCGSVGAYGYKSIPVPNEHNAVHISSPNQPDVLILSSQKAIDECKRQLRDMYYAEYPDIDSWYRDRKNAEDE